MRGLISLLLSSLLLSGCVALPYKEMEPRIDRWVEEKEYGNALDTLAGVDPKDPDYISASKRHKEVEEKAGLYEISVVKEAEKDIRKGRWDTALDSYDTALDRLPKSVVLKDGLAKIHKKQQEKSESLGRERLLLHGEWLEQSLPIFRELARVNPRNSSIEGDYKRKRDEAETIALELEGYGTERLDQDDLKGAERYLSLAIKLNPTQSLENKWNSLEKKRAEEKKARASKLASQKRTKAQRDKKRRDNLKKLTSTYHSQFKKRDFVAARSTLSKLKDGGMDKSDLRKMENELEGEISREVDRLNNLAVASYSRGKYENAAQMWRKVLALQPDHEQAKESLERAERVISKLNELQRKGQ